MATLWFDAIGCGLAGAYAYSYLKVQEIAMPATILTAHVGLS